MILNDIFTLNDFTQKIKFICPNFTFNSSIRVMRDYSWMYLKKKNKSSTPCLLSTTNVCGLYTSYMLISHKYYIKERVSLFFGLRGTKNMQNRIWLNTTYLIHSLTRKFSFVLMEKKWKWNFLFLLFLLMLSVFSPFNRNVRNVYCWRHVYWGVKSKRWKKILSLKE